MFGEFRSTTGGFSDHGSNSRLAWSSSRRCDFDRSSRLATVCHNYLVVQLVYLFSSDRFRTTVNVISDSLGTGIIEHLSRDQLADIGRRKYSRVPRNDQTEELELNIRL